MADVTRGARTTIGRSVMGGLAVAAVVFEQSPANEALRAAAGLETLDRTGSSLLVGGVVALITIVIEGISGSLVAVGIHQFPALLDRLRSFGGRGQDVEPTSTVGARVTDLAIALGIGAAFVVIRRSAVDRTASLRDHLRVVAEATAVIALVSGAIGALAAGGITHAARVGLERPAQLLVDYGTDWRFWLVVGGLAQFGPPLVRRLRR